MTESRSRRSFLTLLSVSKGRPEVPATIYPRVKVDNIQSSALRVIDGNSAEFEVAVNSRAIRLPYTMLLEVWNKSNVGEEICVKLSETIVESHEDGNLDIEKKSNNTTWAGRIAI